MTISDGEEQGKAFLGRIPGEVWVLIILVLTATLAFGLGIMAGKAMEGEQERDGFWIEQLPAGTVQGGGGPAGAAAALPPTPKLETKPVLPAEPEVRTYVASKNGEKYYLPSCGTAKRIKEENKVWFGTKEEAESAGYLPGANCPGL